MKSTDEIVKHPSLRNIELSIDGGRAVIHVGRWDGSVIWSHGAGFNHVSVCPFAKRITPEYSDMQKVKEIFWNDEEAAIQIHPPKSEYVNNVENCLHLWECYYKEQPLPPSCLVGVKPGQTMAELKEEIKKAYEIAGEKYE